jgi:hypothetical protein
MLKLLELLISLTKITSFYVQISSEQLTPVTSK